jgi:hypothetical protein
MPMSGRGGALGEGGGEGCESDRREEACIIDIRAKVCAKMIWKDAGPKNADRDTIFLGKGR